MKLGVTGYGVVGKATADVLRRLGHTVVVHDTDPARVEAALAEGFAPRYEAEGVTVDFVCVPETHIEEALAALPESPVAVIRSTVPPGTTDRLSEAYGRQFAFMPEFLREATSQWDALNPAFILIGCYDREKGAILAEIFAPLMVQVIQVTPPVAETVKLTMNSYLHTLISFWNEIHLICEQIGVPSHLVGKLCSQDPRVPTYGATMHGLPAGGRCLPKDIEQMIQFASQVNYSADFLKSAQQVNDKVAAKAPASANGNGNGHHALDDYAELLPRTGVVHLGW